MSLRILKYEILVIESAKDNSLKNKKEKVYPTVIPIVLYTGRKRWDAEVFFLNLRTEFAKYRGIEVAKYNLIDINDSNEKELLNERSILSKAMLIEKSKNKEELKENLKKIVQEVSINPNIYTKEQVEILINIMKYILINKVEKKEIEKLIRILRGDKNMLAVLEMLEEEDRKTFNKGKKEGKKEGKKKKKNQWLKK